MADMGSNEAEDQVPGSSTAEFGNVRVWWEPTDNAARSGFAGAWWPAKVLGRNNKKLRVRYDNGEEDDVLIEHVSPLDTLPVNFGEEEYPLAKGEFCEVFNGSKTDPCAWLGRVVKLIKSSGNYMVEYPFHDAKPERIEPQRIRRARIMEGGEWHLIRPHQQWEDGDVTSPAELELIHEDELWDHVEEQQDAAAKGEDDDFEIEILSSSSSSSGSEGDDDDGKDDDDGRPRKKRKRGLAGGKKKGRVTDSGGGGGGGARAGMSGDGIPRGCMGLYVTLEPTPSGSFSLVPVPASAAVPSTAVPVFFPLSALPLVSEGAKTHLLGCAQMRIAATGPVGAAARRAASPSSAGTSHMAVLSADRKKAEPPKRFKTSWNCYVEIKRKEVADAHPDKSHQEVLQIMGNMWRALPPAERRIYELEAERSKAAYQAEKAKYVVQTDNVAAAQQAARQPRPMPNRKGRDDAPSSSAPAPTAGAPGTVAMAAARSGAPPTTSSAAAKPQAAAGPAGAGAVLANAALQLSKALAATGAAPSLASEPPPMPARTAKDLYTEEFTKALATAPGLVMPLSKQTAMAAAAASWESVDPSVKSRYQDKAIADTKRYEREYEAWKKRQTTGVTAAPKAAGPAKPAADRSAAGAPSTSGSHANGSSIDLNNIDDVLTKGIDLKAAQRKLQDLGFAPVAYLMLTDAWRKESPRVMEVVGLYKQHVHGRDTPDWDAFMRGVVGNDVQLKVKQDDKA